MKKLFSLATLAVACFLVSCEGGTVKSANTNDKNLQANRDIYKGIETGDTSKFSTIADDAVDHDGPNGEMKGGQTIKSMLAGFHNHIKNLKMDVITDAANNEYVFTLSRMTGTALDSSMGFPAGHNIDSKSVDLVKFKDGKISEHWGFVNMTEMMQMMKNMPMPSGMDEKKGMMEMKKDSTK